MKRFKCNKFSGFESAGAALIPLRPVFHPKTRPGVTLIELMVVVFIMTIVAGAAMVFFRTTAENETLQQENIAQIQNLRTAFYTVASDVRMAGSGLGLLGNGLVQIYVDPKVAMADPSDTQEGDDGGWFRYKDAEHYGVRAIFGTDSEGDKTKADTLTIFRADLEAFSSMTTLRQDYNPASDGSLSLTTSLEEGEDLTSGDIIAVSSGTVVVILQGNLPSTPSDTLEIGSRFRPNAALPEPSGYVFPAGSAVFNLKDVSFVTYYLDTKENRLMANYHDLLDNASQDPNLAVVSSNIEDFQVNYYLASSLEGTSDVAQSSIAEKDFDDGQWVHAIKMGMVSVSGRKTGPGEPVEIMEHTIEGEPERPRRVLIENVKLRNY